MEQLQVLTVMAPFSSLKIDHSLNAAIYTCYVQRLGKDEQQEDIVAFS